MALQKCSLAVDKAAKELIAHGTAQFPCAGYDSVYQQEKEESITWHWHEEIEMIRILKGSLDLKVPSASFCLKEGDCAVINSNILHSGTPIGACALNSLVFSPRLVTGTPDSAFAVKYMEPLISCPSFSCCFFPKETAREVCGFFDAAFAALAEESFGYEFIIRENLSRICLQLFHRFEGQMDLSGSGEHTDSQRIRVMLAYIHQHFSETITLADIARSADIGERECLRCFQKTIQTSPIQYLLKYRIMQGAQLLVSMPAKGVSEIAFLCGFDSPSNFAKMFKRFYHCTPREYRSGS